MLHSNCMHCCKALVLQWCILIHAATRQLIWVISKTSLHHIMVVQQPAPPFPTKSTYLYTWVLWNNQINQWFQPDDNASNHLCLLLTHTHTHITGATTQSSLVESEREVSPMKSSYVQWPTYLLIPRFLFEVYGKDSMTDAGTYTHKAIYYQYCACWYNSTACSSCVDQQTACSSTT